MYIQIAENGSLTLLEMDDMKSFSVREVSNLSGAGLANVALADIALAVEDNHYWIDAQAVITLSGESSDSPWATDFWKMLAAVEPYGYFDKETSRVKAHVNV